jgi:hypothetical protein
MNKIVAQFLQKVREHGGQSIIKLVSLGHPVLIPLNDTSLKVEAGADSAKTHDTSAVRELIGEELNRMVQEMNRSRTKRYNEATRQVQVETEALIRAHQQSLDDRDRENDSLAPVTPLILPTPPAIELELLEEFELKDRSKRGI